jgi:hypothetical protein
MDSKAGTFTYNFDNGIEALAGSNGIWHCDANDSGCAQGDQWNSGEDVLELHFPGRVELDWIRR